MADDVAGEGAGGLLGRLVELAEEPRYRPGPPCGVDLAVKKIRETDPTAADQLVALIDGTVSSSLLSAALREHGIVVSPQSLARHRRRGASNGCRCPR